MILVVGAAIYFYMSGTPTDDSSLEVSDTASDVDLVGGRVLSLLTQINHLKIEAEFFQDASYKSLVDHTVPIYEQGVGKSNPFLNPNRKAAAATTASR